MNIYKNSPDLIGNTPLVEIKNFAPECEATLVAKIEFFNPAGSVKDRIGLAMINDAEERGLIKKGDTIIEPTSGNTGIGLAQVCAVKGYKLILTMPESMSIERRKLLAVYGAEIVLTPAAKGMKGAIEEAKRLISEGAGQYMPMQFENTANSKAHYNTTGPEIWRDTDGKVDIFVAGVGTGGTISGVGKFLKEQNPNVKIVAVEPEKSPVLSGGNAGPHGIQGIGAGFVPPILETELIDEVVKVADEKAIEYSKKLAKTEGLFVGISSGAALVAATEIASRAENKGKLVVVLLPDTGDRYLSTALVD